jgi:CDGSH iron-sulfur domain-containing protein 3
MTKAKIFQKSPIIVDLKAGQTYAWCSCGFSAKQPFCDGSHRNADTELKSVKYTADEDKKVAFCGCKQTKNAPICDGSHQAL